MAEKRKDKARTVLRTGEVQRKNGTYQYSWMDGQLKRRFVYAKTLAELNIKVIQDTLGHTDISTTLNIYTDVTKELKTAEFKGLDTYFKS